MRKTINLNTLARYVKKTAKVNAMSKVLRNIYSVNAAVLVAAGRKTHSQGAFAVPYGYGTATERDIVLLWTVTEYCWSVCGQMLSAMFRPKSVGLGFDTQI